MQAEAGTSCVGYPALTKSLDSNMPMNIPACLSTKGALNFMPWLLEETAFGVSPLETSRMPIGNARSQSAVETNDNFDDIFHS